MSYDIEYKRKVYVIEEKDGYTPNLLAVHLIGSNNVYDTCSNKRAREWQFYAYGWEYSIIQRVCKWAGYCEGGGLQPNGRSTTPENYLKSWRGTIKEAEPISNFFKEFGVKEGYIKISDFKNRFEKLDKYTQKSIKRLQKEKGFEEVDKPDYYEIISNNNEEKINKIFTIQLTDIESIRLWIRYRNICDSGLYLLNGMEV